MADMTWEKLIESIGDKDVDDALTRLAIEVDKLPSAVSEAYARSGVTLVLGAGVSKSCGIPSWPELLLRLHAHSLGSLGATNIDSLAAAYGAAVEGEGPLISARIAALGTDDTALRELVRKAFYEPTPGESDLIKAIARVSNQCENEARVRGVLTYNYDTLLEDQLEKIGRDYDRKDRRDRGTGRGLPIRHVHGFLAPVKHPDEWLVLTEQQYHVEYATPYTWSNVVQLNAFRETTCIFIGLSMSDPNLRRLLESSRSTATPSHFAFLRRASKSSLSEAIAAHWEGRGRGMGRPSGVEAAQVEKRLQLLCDLADSNRASALKELGVAVIWYSGHDQLPSLIESIRKT